jgi:thiosulfate reductase cytochrome b subunit
MDESIANNARALDARGARVYRHPLPVRIAHWINVLALAILLMSGLQIFNAHPALYWGEASDFARPVFRVHDERSDAGRPVGITSLFAWRFETTGVLGWSTHDGQSAYRAFPAWLTIPSYQDLATGRVWHFFFAWLFVINGVIYLGYSVMSRHISRDLLPTLAQTKQIGCSIRQHLSARFYGRERHAGYNVIQKLSYLVVIFVLLPAMLLTGLTMSPAINAAAPWLLDVFDGRQSARTIHFATGSLLVLFVLVHVLMVVSSGLVNNLRSMVTGWYSLVPPGVGRDDEA